MNTPLYDAVVLHNKKNMISMHMPAHKGASDALSALGGMQSFDITEIPDTGSLFDGEGATALAEAEAARLFGTKATFMSAGGCTLCIQAMLRAAAPQGGKVICGRVIHRSAINTMSLAGIDPVWVLTDGSAGEHFSGRITPEAVDEALKSNPDAKAVYITSPDYFGVISDVEGIAKTAAAYGVPLIVDSAHGAHLHFLNGDISPVRLGAAMCADSAHKTLPVLTGGAWLQVAQRRFVPDIRSAMALFGSTSPSYPIMISLDLARAWLEENGEREFSRLAEKIEKIKTECGQLGLSIPQGFCDPIRLAFDTTPLGFSGGEFGEQLRLLGVEPEYSGRGKVILIPSVFNTDSELDRLSAAIKTVCKSGKKSDVSVSAQYTLPLKVMPPYEAILSFNETVPVEESLGKVAAETFCPCPPAIPVVMPGERIDEKAIEQLRDYGIFNIKVVK